ncbi:MAG: hypothetical protein IJY28_10195 [Clostridia bacterium]|nr:hypothetical protein [Clostridia bacterium]
MKKHRKSEPHFAPTAFYDREAHRIPAWKFVLPLMMVLVAVAAVVLAYREGFPDGLGVPLSVLLEELQRLK